MFFKSSGNFFFKLSFTYSAEIVPPQTPNFEVCLLIEAAGWLARFWPMFPFYTP